MEFSFRRKTIDNDFSLNDFKKDLLQLKSSESKIWELHNSNDVSSLFSNIKNKSHMYFIHSYEFMTKQKECVVAMTNYGSSIIVSVAKDNIVGTQFHPEKSQRNGLVILENFLKWKL